VTSLSVMAKQSLVMGEMTNELLPERGGVLMPTPTVGDSRAARNSTAKRKSVPPSGLHAGDTLTDAVTLLREDQ
jgi:hypothetical protein